LTLKIKAAPSSETSVSTYNDTWCHNLEYNNLGIDKIFKKNRRKTRKERIRNKKKIREILK
jgi:hypothetical protein